MAKGFAIAAAIGVAGLLGAGAAWVWLAPGSDPFANCREGQVAGGGDIGGPFTLVNTEGETVTDADVLTKPSLVYFGYTFCPDVCPLDVSRNAQAVDILEERGLDVQPVFISFDPPRDTPEVLAAYAEAMHPRLIALTGSEAQVAAASQAYRTYFKAQPAEDEFYLIDHSTFTYLMLPGSGFAEFFGREVRAEQMADRVSCFLGAA